MTTNYNIKKIISSIKSELKDFYPDNEINSFVYLIFEKIAGIARTRLLISDQEELSEKQYKKIHGILMQLKSYKPIQYILGETEFYELPFKVGEGVLIPRPETEELVDWIIKENKNNCKEILDIGTGSGCIAIALAENLKSSKVYACDVSDTALSLAKQNSRKNDAEISFFHLDILSPNLDLDKKFDVVVSNPPYVTEGEKKLMEQNVLAFEPELALFVPDDNPLVFYKAIVNFSKSYLNHGGEIYLEINEAFGRQMVDLLNRSGFDPVILKKDMSGKDRMIKGILKKN